MFEGYFSISYSCMILTNFTELLIEITCNSGIPEVSLHLFQRVGSPYSKLMLTLILSNWLVVAFKTINISLG